jgi:hypothetical protein
MPRPKSPEIQTADQQLKRALELLSSEEADAIIGEPGEGYQALLEGVQAAQGILWAGMKLHGVRQNPKSLKIISQNLVILQTLVHYAYALGLRRAQEEQGA